MAQMFYAQDCNLEYLMGKKIAIVGYGSQGHAHALNLRDSGCDVVVALYEGSKSWKKAEDAGLTVVTTAEAAKVADMIMILINDEKQAAMYHKDIEPYLRPGMILAFAHGFNIHFGCIKPPKDIDVVMIAPKGPGHTVRSQYLEGKGVPDLIAVYQDASAGRRITRWHMRRASAAHAPASSRRRSARRPRPTCSASSASSAAASDRADEGGL